MARLKVCMWLLLASFCLWCVPNEAKAEVTEPIELEGVKLDVKKVPTLHQPITNTPIEILGPEQETTL